MAKVVTTFVSDDKEMQASIDKYNKKIDQLIAENRKLAEESRQASRSANSGLEAMVGNALKAATAWASIGTAINVTRREWEAFEAFQNRAASTQTQAANAQAALSRNLGQIGVPERKRIFSEIDNISKETGVTPTALYNAASLATSASSGMSNDAMLDAVRYAAKVAADSPNVEMPSTAAGLLDLAGLTKSDDARSNLGFMLQMGSQTRVESLDFISKNLVPAAKGVHAFGGDAEEAAGLVTTLTSMMNDATGATSGSAAIRLAKSLDDIFPDTGPDFDSAIQKIAALQNDPLKRKKFFQKASIEDKAFAPIKALLEGGEAGALLAENIGLMRKASPERADKFLEEHNFTEIQQGANLERQAAATRERQMNAALESGDAARVRSLALGVAGDAEPGYLKGLTRRLAYSGAFHETPREAAQRTLETQLFREQALVRRHEMLGEGTDEAYQKNLKDVDALQHMISVLERSAETLDAIKNAQRAPGPDTHGETK